MGSAASKANSSGAESPENVASSAPISTPQIRRLDLDPRSPSSDIARTPIEILKTPSTNSAMSTADNTLDDMEDVSINKQLILPSELDPRSPTTEFHRTPIIVENTLKLHNKNLDNARMPLVTVTPIKPKRLSERVVKKIYSAPAVSFANVTPPKLLESSLIEMKVPENKRHSVVGLLETNIDFVETDLDAVIQSKMYGNCNELPEEPAECTDESDEDVKAISATDSAEEADDSCSSSNSELDAVVHNPSGTSSASVELDLLPDDELKTEHEIVVTKDGATAASNANALTMLSVEELNRKLTNLIYEDKQLEASPKISKPIVTHRTPLSERDANSQQRKSIPKLKVSDKPTKCPAVGISKIPVFKEKKLKGKVNVQCENTPPRVQQKHSHWAAEDSIII